MDFYFAYLWIYIWVSSGLVIQWKSTTMKLIFRFVLNLLWLSVLGTRPPVSSTKRPCVCRRTSWRAKISHTHIALFWSAVVCGNPLLQVTIYTLFWFVLRVSADPENRQACRQLWGWLPDFFTLLLSMVILQCVVRIVFRELFLQAPFAI